MSACPPAGCAGCSPARNSASLRRLGLKLENWDHVVALAGNPNTGKSTVFNNLTGLRQHTGNWPGKTIARAEGGFSYEERRYKLVDLPGTYSLLSASPDEEVARDFLLFGEPDVTVVVVDATALERNLNLALQVLQITDRVVVCVNLMDEARAHGLEVDVRGLARDLGVPVVATAARQREGMDRLLEEIDRMATGRTECRPRRVGFDVPGLREAIERLAAEVEAAVPGIPNAPWIALRLLHGDESVRRAVTAGELGRLTVGEGEGAGAGSTPAIEGVLRLADELRWQVPPDYHERCVERIYGESARIATRNVTRSGAPTRQTWQRRLDLLLTGRWTGFPMMVVLLAAALWLTITGANVPSRMLAGVLVDQLHPALKGLLAGWGVPWWVNGPLIDGMYLTTAWVISVMLPPMAIFFPVFTLLEDFGYLPRVAFNLDRLFQKAGAHGKQALTMTMGWGCNAAGVTACRIIDSPRERLIAILTNNFALCNGRWPTQILIATVFLGALAPPAYAGLVAAASVLGVALLGVGLSLVVSWGLSRTLLKGEASTFSLELPPYRPPRFWRTLYTSLIDRTLFVLWRAILFAAPAGLAIWCVANIEVGDRSLALWAIGAFEPLAWTMGLTGVILLAYVIAIPANEIVVPSILMLTVLATGMTELGQGAGVMFETGDDNVLKQLLTAGGWTTLTAVCLMLFSLCHNPCSTTLYTIYKETGSVKWTVWAAAIPTVIGYLLCAGVALAWRWVV